MAQRIDANAQSILDEVKKEMNIVGIKSPSYSDAIRYGVTAAREIDANAQGILDEVKKEMNMMGIKYPSYSDAIRFLHNKTTEQHPKT